jgi:glycosyltransferase involved in cell wall biosynthesis
MRIILVNWAKIWDGATLGGGVNGYCQALALALVRRGHDVVSLSGGTTYSPDPRPAGHKDSSGPCEVRRHPDWLGIRVFEVVNSPVLAPSILQFREPLAEASSPELESRVEDLCRLIAPDVVHFHNIEGFSAGCIAAAQRAGAAVLFSLHNYQPVCPQVYLMQGHRRPCRSFDSGRACEGCIEAPDPAQERRSRALNILPSPVREAAIPPVAQEPVLGRLFHELGSLVRPRSAPALSEAQAIPGIPADSASAITAPLPPPEGDSRGKTRFLLGELQPRLWPSALDPDWQPLDNTPTPDPCGDGSNPYAARRRAMVEMLSRCSRVLAVSDFVRSKYEALGVSPAVLRTLHIGSRAPEVAARHAELVFDPPPFDGPGPTRPIRLVFMGYNHWYKGLSMLADTLELLTPEYLRRIDLSVFALGGESIEWRFRRMEPRLAALKLGHGYEYHDIPWICGGRDLGLVPSVWWDNAPQTVFEFFACGLPILGADLGGIPDFVRHGHNGLLFRGNDRFAMARELVRVIRDPSILPGLRANVRPPKGIDEHSEELERLYAECVSFRAGSVPSPAALRA